MTTKTPDTRPLRQILRAQHCLVPDIAGGSVVTPQRQPGRDGHTWIKSTQLTETELQAAETALGRVAYAADLNMVLQWVQAHEHQIRRPTPAGDPVQLDPDAFHQVIPDSIEEASALGFDLERPYDPTSTTR